MFKFKIYMLPVVLTIAIYLISQYQDAYTVKEKLLVIVKWLFITIVILLAYYYVGERAIG